MIWNGCFWLEFCYIASLRLEIWKGQEFQCDRAALGLKTNPHWDWMGLVRAYWGGKKTRQHTLIEKCNVLLLVMVEWAGRVIDALFNFYMAASPFSCCLRRTCLKTKRAPFCFSAWLRSKANRPFTVSFLSFHLSLYRSRGGKKWHQKPFIFIFVVKGKKCNI